MAKLTRYERVMRGAARYVGYYRSNPHIFARDYLHLRLKIFQKILLVMMNWSNISIFIGARGIGKTFLSAVFCVTRMVLYPGTKIVIVSGTRGQATNLLEKILLELKPNSKELAAEIDDKQTKVNGTNAQVVLKNGSFCKVVTASDSARGSRANVLLIDEFRLVDKNVIDTVLKKFLTQRRMPAYAKLTDKERNAAYDKERNKTLYLSSAYFTDHWSYTLCCDIMKSMVGSEHKAFVCGLPYELSICEGLLDKETVQDEMCESDFSEVKHAMEYEALWYGSTEGAFFDYDSVSKNRKIKYPWLPDKLAGKLHSDPLVRIPPRKPGEKRLISADIALMASKRKENDATAIHITQLMPTKAGRYCVNLMYSEVNEGMRTEDQALVIRKYYEEFDCDFIVLDTRSVGLSIFDCLAREMSDIETGEVYPPLSCYNNSDIAARCVDRSAPKVIWAIMGSLKFNSDIALTLREGFRSSHIRLLQNEYDAEENLKQIRSYNTLGQQEKIAVMMPYINTTLMINEIVNLQHEDVNGMVKVHEKSGMRKDRYSSIAYNYWVALQLEAKLRKSVVNELEVNSTKFHFRAPKVK